ncbi:MAG: heavy-metal-associated domain-containing protein [Gemmatimonadetes bacterium]|nr:heavy-metal-associated domain-containing protein [Gemmatimonadota bacterium]
MVLQRIPGVERADVSFATGLAVVLYDPAVTTPDELCAELERMTGFAATVVQANGERDSVPRT